MFRFAGYFLFYNIAHKMQFTNHGINFFLYVISGKKFGTDLRHLFVTSGSFKEDKIVSKRSMNNLFLPGAQPSLIN